jgi:predicted permease
MSKLWRRIAFLLLRRRFDRGLEDEMRFHLEMKAMAGGGTTDARYAALRQFGNATLLCEESREQWGWLRLETLVQDLRYGLRLLVKNPGFTAVAAAALALGIGVNTAIFSFADVVLTHPIALADLDRLVSIRERASESGDYEPLAPADYLDLRSRSKTLQPIAAYEYWGASLGGRGGPEMIPGVRVTAEFFDALGVTPALGRAFSPGEQEPGRNRVVILSHRFSRQQFATNGALGCNLVLDGERYTVVGVMPPAFHFPLGGQDFWTPLPMGPSERNEHTKRYVLPVGRLGEGVPIEQARAEIDTIWRGLRTQYRTADSTRTLTVRPLRDQVVGENDRQFTLFLMGVVVLVLLIACANVANLQLARGARRSREIAVRAAVGGGRLRIMRQLVTESLALSLLGAALGLVFAAWAVPLLRVTLPPELNSICDLDSIRLNLRVLLFTFAIACGAGVISGLTPALHQSRTDLNGVLKEGSGRATTRTGQRLRGIFVVAELALSLILLINAGLMVKGFLTVASRQPETQPNRLLTFHVTLPEARYRNANELRAFFASALSRLPGVPRVASVAVASGLPYSFYDDSVNVTMEGRSTAPKGESPTAMMEAVSNDYFRTMHIPLRGGREFNRRDGADAAPVAIVSRSMADRLWPGQEALGKRVKLNADAWLTVVGTVGDLRHEVYDRAFRSTTYVPYQQAPPRAADFVLRTSEDAMALVSAVRNEMHQLDRNLAVETVETMSAKIARQAAALRYVASLMIIFGMAALVLCSMGVYGLVSYSVAERGHEIGIRVALGAEPLRLLWTITGSGLRLTAIGLAVGIPSALVLAQLLSSMIYGVRPWDLTIFIAAPLALACIAALACVIPAGRAIQVDPMEVLHYE